MDCRTSGEPFLGRRDTEHLSVCCTIQNKARDLKAVEETVEAKDSRRHGKWAKFGGKTAMDFGRTSSSTSKGRKEIDGSDMSKQDDAFTITKFPLQVLRWHRRFVLYQSQRLLREPLHDVTYQVSLPLSLSILLDGIHVDPVLGFLLI